MTVNQLLSVISPSRRSHVIGMFISDIHSGESHSLTLFTENDSPIWGSAMVVSFDWGSDYIFLEVEA